MLEWAPNLDPMGASPTCRLLAQWWNRCYFCFKECFQTLIFMLEKGSAFIKSCRYWLRILVNAKLSFTCISPPLLLSKLFAMPSASPEGRMRRTERLSAAIDSELFRGKAESAGRSWITVIVGMAAPAGSLAGEAMQCLCFDTFPLRWIYSLANSKSNCAGFEYNEKAVKSDSQSCCKTAVASIPVHLLNSCPCAVELSTRWKGIANAGSSGASSVTEWPEGVWSLEPRSTTHPSSPSLKCQQHLSG